MEPTETSRSETAEASRHPQEELYMRLGPQKKGKDSKRRKKKSKSKMQSCGSCPGYMFSNAGDDDFSDSESTEIESSTDEEERWKDVARTSEIPVDYYNIQKLVKYIKAGNQTATIVSLCCLKDYNLKVQINQFAIQDMGGLEVLVNILESNDSKCRLGALSVLADISLNIDIRKTIVDLDGVPLLVDILSTSHKDLKTMAAETIANIAKVRLARKYIRTCGGIPKLVDLLDVRLHILQNPRENLTLEEQDLLFMARAGARALWSLSDSRHNKEQMRRSGIVPLMARLLKSVHIDIVIPIMGTIQKCASQPKFQLAITSENMVSDIIKHLNTQNLDLKMEGSTAIFKCAFDPTTRQLVHESNGIEPLVGIIKDKTLRDYRALMVGTTGALWMCAASENNVKRLDSLRAMPHLVNLLTHDDDEVLTNTVGCISEVLRYPVNRDGFRAIGGIPPLITLLNSSCPPLLENLSKAVKEIADDPDSMRVLEKYDAVRLVWSLLKNPNPRVQTYAAYAICPCVKNALEPGEMVRSLVGAMELLVILLKSEHVTVLSAVCAAIATIAKDTVNLSILTDLKVIYKLSKLVHTEDDLLRENLADAVASCAAFDHNTELLGRLHTVTPIVTYLTSDSPAVHRTTAMALEQLSKDPQNCITMHQSGVVPFLLECISSNNKDLQLAAAGCLKNIRELALRTEEYFLKLDEDK
ncbi:armadillo repeat-containing protein gudu [Teleopsis dalmanni]|uniref:armadillo repeat-containing protein gudu n=1 Tax=Teleopsis dalmanni TaxID=139649 RepID=UPI0018CD494A|nr:armadillo repeat-containing protein gudu [Teleopsis dalmanni]